MSTPVANPGAFNKKGQRHTKKWHWTRNEDALLTLLVQRYGAANWDHIAHYIEGRTGKSCRVRWINQLNPGINKSPFSAEDQQRLLQLHEIYGNKWSTIATFFLGRTDNQLKNQYHVLMRTRCMKSPNPGLSHYGNSNIIPPVSKFSNVSSPGTHYRTDGFQTMPSILYGSGEPFLVPFPSDPYWLYPNSLDVANPNPADTVIPYNAISGAFPGMSDVNLPQQVGLNNEHSFINFFGKKK